MADTDINTDTNTKKSWFARHKILTAILAFIVLMVVVQVAGGNKETGNNSANNTQNANTSEPANNEESESTKLAKIGETVRDGKFEFVVKSVECGKTEVVSPQSDALRKDAQGQYCLMSLTVKNIGNEQQYFSESDQKLLNATNQQYSPDSTATLYNGANSDAFLAQINPGNSVEGVLVYDIPKDQKPVIAELHDSAFSDGVKVSLE